MLTSASDTSPFAKDSDFFRSRGSASLANDKDFLKLRISSAAGFLDVPGCSSRVLSISPGTSSSDEQASESEFRANKGPKFSLDRLVVDCPSLNLVDDLTGVCIPGVEGMCTPGEAAGVFSMTLLMGVLAWGLAGVEKPFCGVVLNFRDRMEEDCCFTGVKRGDSGVCC